MKRLITGTEEVIVVKDGCEYSFMGLGSGSTKSEGLDGGVI